MHTVPAKIPLYRMVSKPRGITNIYAYHSNVPVRYCPSSKYIYDISYLRILALQFVAIAPRFSSPGIAKIGKGST